MWAFRSLDWLFSGQVKIRSLIFYIYSRYLGGYYLCFVSRNIVRAPSALLSESYLATDLEKKFLSKRKCHNNTDFLGGEKQRNFLICPSHERTTFFINWNKYLRRSHGRSTNCFWNTCSNENRLILAGQNDRNTGGLFQANICFAFGTFFREEILTCLPFNFRFLSAIG